MKLSMLDLAASLVKNFDYQMENFFDEICRENSSMGIDQDVLIKLLLHAHRIYAIGTKKISACFGQRKMV